ncbi:MAG: nucleotidyl transferase AbiEii/AbiGii toxin family protein [Patescibacteria group bacterium]|nr:nucleotidyl transferase AbiEii/AbiGii toxin family protein [Patescibacteria group bacterium]
MITRQFITDFSTKYQTTEGNIAREYCQHLFLSYFYKKEKSEKILFKGGTALRIIFKSPRFSEDLDFSVVNGREINIAEINQLIDNTLADIKNEGIDCEKILNPGTQGETTGGYFAIIRMKMLEFNSEIRLQISFRSPDQTISNTHLIQNDFITPYVITYLKESLLVSEKIQALLDRKKPRDFFDLYFILRHKELVKFIPPIPNLKNQLFEIINQEKEIEKELKLFLPVSYQTLLKDFKERLQREIEIYIS